MTSTSVSLAWSLPCRRRCRRCESEDNKVVRARMEEEGKSLRARIAEIERQLLTTKESRGSAPATFAELRRSERPYPLHGTLVRLPLKCAQL